ncbi:M4 family metallopeptidase [Pseudoduganella namucuonensis]|uniref:Neutral metalloproteinase n=1 Tax=Pseudoduganella namucuonensis TaxID=1035707 RepID=A0A1I7L925_9BURK|nr:M4 family metallopeptidase [Pseudoduganella namucuonensis]SFV06223.1 Zn-dependent metalloprotease [Pseudoduganella namucuonensis]
MAIRKTLIAAAIAATVATAVQAAPVMGGPAAFSPQEKARLVSTLNGERGKHGLDADHGFAIASQHPGARGTAISRLNHTYKGVRVYESESVVVSDDAGNIVSESIADRRKDLAAKRMNVKPRLQQKDAINAALRAVGPYSAQIDPPSAELIIYPVMKTYRVAEAANKAESELNAMDVFEAVESYKLAYLVQTRMANGNKPVYHNTIVNAQDGSVLEQWNMVQNVVGTGNSQYNGSVPINTTLSGTTYKMIDGSRGTGGTFGAMAITNANHTTSAGSVYTNASNTWGDGKQYIAGGSTTDANGQTAAVNAMWGLMNTYDMHKNVLGWQSLDGNNTATYIAAHVNTAYDNAYYSDTCKCMYIGDGGSYFNNLGSIDVIGHEMGHGITAATSNLAYRGESGGLNESGSDIAGEAVEAYARAGGAGATLPSPGANDWMMGQEIAKNGQPLRWMYKPSKDGSSPDAWSTSLKRLDVHYSSGPNNRMFYFLAKGSNSSSTSDYYSKYLTKAPLAMTGIGLDKAYRIWFKALTTKFTSSTNYADARLKVLAAAQELYGVNSAEAKAVQRAYAAINVGADIAE